MSSNKEILGLHRITKEHLKDLCKRHRLYQTPHLNDQLYLHYQGFQAIENLDEYTGLKCLWLECNAISEIQGLHSLKELKCLFLQNNLIRKIEHLDGCSGLDTLNLASNHITKIENCGVDVLPVLSTLNLSRNQIQSSDALKELVNCTSLWSLDLSHNRIDDILVVKIFANMPELRVLVLQGNPVVNRVPQYRKTLILECKKLTYLDSRPVFPKDRACAEAWKRGGYDEERKEHERWNRKDRMKIRDSVNATLSLRRKNGDKEVQLIPSTDDEEEENERETVQDLEITGIKPENDEAALETKADGEEPKASEIKVTLEGSSIQSGGASGSEIIDNAEAVQDVLQEKAADQQPTLLDDECKEVELPTESPSQGPVTEEPSTEHSTATNHSDTSSSSSELSSDSDSVDTDESDIDEEEDDSRLNEEPMMEDDTKEDNQSAPVLLEESTKSDESEDEDDKAGGDSLGSNIDPSDSDAVSDSSMSFDESQSFSYKTEPRETMKASDEDDSGLFNSLQTTSSFTKTDNHDDTTLTCEAGSTECPSPDSSIDETFYQEPENDSINPEDITLPDDIEGNSWLSNFLAGLQAEQDRDRDDSSSLTDSSEEGCSDGETGATQSPEPDEHKPEAGENVSEAAAEGEIWLKNVLTSPKNTEETSPKPEGSVDATNLLDSILAEAHLNIDESTFREWQTSEDAHSSDNESSSTTEPELPAFSATLLDGLDSFNKVVETINKRREERLQKINDFVNHPQDALQTEEQLDQQIEQIKQEKHERVRQLVEQVYAQRDDYDDTLELIEGRLMVVKRETGALEEVQPPPSRGGTGTSTHIDSPTSFSNQGVSATPHECKREPLSPAESSESDDYGTPLSSGNDEHDDEEVEQHRSDTKISKITLPSAVNEVDSSAMSAARTSTCGQDEVEVSFERDFREEQEESVQRVMQLHRNIDADVFSEVTKWMDEGGDVPSVSPTRVRLGMGREEIMLLRQEVKVESADELEEEGAGTFELIPSGDD